MNEPKKILMLAATPFFSDRGCHIRIFGEMKYLIRRGFDVRLVTYDLGYNPKEIDPERIVRTVKIPGYTKLSPGFHVGKIFADFFLLFTAIKEYFRFKPDVIHAHLYEALTAGIILKILTFGRAKLVFDCQGSLAEEMSRYTLSKNAFLKLLVPLFVLIEKVWLLFPDKIYCSSQNSVNFLKNKLGIAEKRVGLLADGLDIELFTAVSDEEKKKLKEGLQIPKENTVIVYAGSVDKGKGVGDLLDAIPDILKKKENLTFLFLGYGRLIEEYTEKLKAQIAAKQVVFYGAISYFEMPRYLTVGDFGIDCKAGSSESSGKLYNYIAAGLPVICFETSFTKQVLGDKMIAIETFTDIGKLDLSKQKITYDVKAFSMEAIVNQFSYNK